MLEFYIVYVYICYCCWYICLKFKCVVVFKYEFYLLVIEVMLKYSNYIYSDFLI